MGDLTDSHWSAILLNGAIVLVAVIVLFRLLRKKK
jgi:hypothetical protein